MRRRLGFLTIILLSAATLVVAQRSAAIVAPAYAERPIAEWVDPMCGPTEGGTWVHVSGHNMELATAVSFGGSISTTIMVIHDQRGVLVRVKVPPHLAGPVRLRAYGPTGWGPAGAPFVYVPLLSPAGACDGYA
jgi:hypothetical protein